MDGAGRRAPSFPTAASKAPSSPPPAGFACPRRDEEDEDEDGFSLPPPPRVSHLSADGGPHLSYCTPAEWFVDTPDSDCGAGAGVKGGKKGGGETETRRATARPQLAYLV